MALLELDFLAKPRQGAKQVTTKRGDWEESHGLTVCWIPPTWFLWKFLTPEILSLPFTTLVDAMVPARKTFMVVGGTV